MKVMNWLAAAVAGGCKPLPVKLSEDICSLLHCRKKHSHIPRSIVKNGKRDKNYLEASEHYLFCPRAKRLPHHNQPL